MKKILIAVPTMFCLFFFSSLIFANTKVGVVDVNKIFLESPQVVAAKADFKKRFEGRKKEISDAQKNLQTAMENFSKNNSTMKEDVKKAEQQKITDQQKKLQEMRTKFQNDVNTAQETTLKDISKKVEDTIIKVSVAKGLDLALVKASVAYSKKELEITDDVLKQMK